MRTKYRHWVNPSTNYTMTKQLNATKGKAVESIQSRHLQTICMQQPVWVWHVKPLQNPFDHFVVSQWQKHKTPIFFFILLQYYITANFTVLTEDECFRNDWENWRFLTFDKWKSRGDVSFQVIMQTAVAVLQSSSSHYAMYIDKIYMRNTLTTTFHHLHVDLIHIIF